ncbi:MAG TPA: protein kinase, partial [Kofleriaceae bacterium]
MIEELGSGGMATVYRARDRELRRDVAIKVLFPHLCKNKEIVARFQREARAAAGLDHPHILRVFDVGGGGEGGGDPPFMVLELVRGPNLAGIVEGGALLAELAAACGAAIAAALAHAHRA